MTDLTARLRALADTVTEGPFLTHSRDEFIAAAREAIPQLCDEVERLTERLEFQTRFSEDAAVEHLLARRRIAELEKQRDRETEIANGWEREARQLREQRDAALAIPEKLDEDYAPEAYRVAYKYGFNSALDQVRQALTTTPEVSND